MIEDKMTPTFQVTLCFCMLGLCFTAPKPRNVRWCVTSDSEEKKCNDIVNSCSIQDILPVCVKRASTEDCMKAISDGDADVISIGSGDVFRASFTPYNLKPIMKESSGLHKAIAPCLMERQRLRARKPAPVGGYVPNCDEKGNFSPMQCHGSTGYCWCVHANGEEIAGTKTPPGQTRPTCGVPVAGAPCSKEQQKIQTLHGDKPPLGLHVPQCDEKGDYHPKQCHGSTGYCWCVTSNGEEIAGTKTPPGQKHPTCGVPVAGAPCLMAQQKIQTLHGDKPPLGLHVPQCDEKGDYHPKQCHGSTGYCWCVTSNGEEIAGTKTPPGQKHPTCGVPVAGAPCLMEQQKIQTLHGDKPPLGLHVPQCDEKGNYHLKQCHGSTGFCWCVTSNGEEIAGTKTPPGQKHPTCGVPVADAPCLKEQQRLQKLHGDQPPRGQYVPDCDEKGDYHPKQCHGSTGYCWCVTSNGEEIAGTKTPPGQKQPTCGVTVAGAPCLKEQQKIQTLHGDKPPLGLHVPQCDEKGDYHTKQCHGSTGYCWCVTSDGEEIAGTKTPPDQKHPTCGIPVAGAPCLKEQQKIQTLHGDRPPLGLHVPQCDEKGDYHPKQCHGSTGFCWCVTSNGEEIVGTKTPPGQKHPTCGVPVDGAPCLKKQQRIQTLHGDRPPLGLHVPQCDEKGDYHPKQCHGSTGYCWCVTSNGEEIAGTKTPPGQEQPICGVPVDGAPCLKKQQKIQTLHGGRPPLGLHVPQCDEKGDYHPKQCHGSTGYCWCVTSNGEEIAGTKTPPGQEQPICGVPVAGAPCLKEQQKIQTLHGVKPPLGLHVPQCDEKGDYHPKQCHGSTGYCWCVTSNGEEIVGTKTPPGQKHPTCGVLVAEAPCLKEQQRLHKLHGDQPPRRQYVPNCDEKGDYHPKQCHGSTGYCWCVTANGEEIAGTKTPPGQKHPTCGITDSDACHYAVAVVSKSSNFQFNDLKGKRSCHAEEGEIAGWYAPINVLLKKKLLQWEGPEKESIEKAVSGFFSASCIPRAREENLCRQCAGKGDNKCQKSQAEPYHGDDGAFRCLRENKGDVAFVKSTALSDEYSENYELLCPDNTRRPLNQPKDCHLGKVPANAVVTRSVGDKTLDITEFLLEAQNKHCNLFGSQHGEHLLFEDSTKSLVPLPPDMDAVLFLGAEWFHDMKALTVGEADAVKMDVDYMETALKCGLVPALEEYPNKDDFGPCKTLGSVIKDFGTDYVVALVKKSNKDITWKTLKGKKSCHREVDHTYGWDLPVSLISKQTGNCDIGSFFSQSCAPGSDINSNFCKLCIGDPENPNANTKCAKNDKEAYYGNAGAFRCLVEKGDMAFLSHVVVFENTDGKNPAIWANKLKSDDFELLCLDGSRASVNDYKNCSIGRTFSHAIVTRQESVADVVRIVNNQQSLFGRNGFEKDMFQLFSSQRGQNVLFNDNTQCLIEFDRMPEKDIFDDYFGKDYAILKLCPSKKGLMSACSFHNC